MVNSTIRHKLSKINQKGLKFFLVKTLKGCVSVYQRNVQSKLSLDYVKTNPEKLVIFLMQNIKRLCQGFLSKILRKVKDFFSTKFQKVVSGFSQQNVKVNSKQSDRQGGQGSKNLLVKSSQG
ncbi:hypothetical protein M0802_014755 [Mischocyttarus mexicanus]|nr:hypothetical protein M0802_014755 [Mischocyttarus mexicanus]